MTHQQNGYVGRNATLLQLGYGSFEEYLSSPLWHLIRKKAFTANGLDCRLCGKSADTLHHRGFGKATLTGERVDLIVPICTSCKQSLRKRKGGSSRTFDEIQGKFSAMWKRSPLNPECVTRGKKPKTDADFLELRSLSGRCRTCGKKARKGTLYCRPHARDVLAAR